MSVLPFDSFANSSEPSVLVARMKAGGAVVLHTMSTAKEALQAVEWTVVDAVWPIPVTMDVDSPSGSCWAPRDWATSVHKHALRRRWRVLAPTNRLRFLP